MNYGSVCSGIEAATVAWHPLGWKPAWFSEIEAFPNAVLAHHYPDVPNLGDMTKIADMVANDFAPAPDVLVGGTPCQAFSVAGMRGGLSDARGQLTLSYVELANAIDAKRAANNNEPCIIVWENVPGVLSSKDNAFGCFLGALAGEDIPLEPPGGKWTNAGYVHVPARAIAWRILDAQYFGVAQRRRRVFVVASARNGFDPAEILFEFEGVRRDSAPRREAGQEVTYDIAPCLTSSGRGVERGEDTRGQAPVVTDIVGGSARDTGHGQPIVSVEVVGTLNSHDAGDFSCNQAVDAGYIIPLAFNHQAGGSHFPISPSADLANTLQASQMQAVVVNYAVRRLMPVECERLQAFPDGYTLVPVGKKQAADGPRYKALGNSMCVNVMQWIGQRIDHALRAEEKRK